MSSDFAAWRATVQADMEGMLLSFLPPATQQPQRLHEAMQYAVLDGGKRVRPLLSFAAGELFDAPRDAVARAAAAVDRHFTTFDSLVGQPVKQKGVKVTR